MVRSLIGGESRTLEIAEGQKNPEEQAEPFMQYREVLEDMFGCSRKVDYLMEDIGYWIDGT